MMGRISMSSVPRISGALPANFVRELTPTGQRHLENGELRDDVAPTKSTWPSARNQKCRAGFEPVVSRE